MMNIALWASQIILAIIFLMAGSMKTFQPLDKLAQTMDWVKSSPPLTRFIGIVEILGVLGLILPAATRILPWLTPIAAIGLAIIMVLAIGFHVIRKEYKTLPVLVVILLLSIFVAYGRFVLAPL